MKHAKPNICAAYLICISLVSVIIYTSGCARREDSIIGAWSSYSDYEYGSEHAEFFADKTFYLDADGLRIVGTWFRVERNRYKLSFPTSNWNSTMILATIIDDYLAFEPDISDQSRLVRDGTTSAKRMIKNINKREAELNTAREKLNIRIRQRENKTNIPNFFTDSSIEFENYQSNIKLGE